jgi:hypothetical protein
MRLKRVILWIAGTFAVLGVGYCFLILDWKGRPFCHKQMVTWFWIWMDHHGKTATYPNVNGRSADSLATIGEEIKGGRMDWAKGYNYVPGLWKDDPGDLVLMYVNSPTRWVSHVRPPSIFQDKAWIVVPVDFKMGSRPWSGPGECSERVSTEEFKSRLRKTLDFVRTNKRPHWQTIVAEHTKFLETIEHVGL